MPNHLQSKTICGLVLLLVAAIGLDIAHLLNHEAADVLKWLGTSFLSVRAVANLPGNSPQ